MSECIFCKIINKQAPAEIIYEDDKFVVFKNIKPSAPIHLLIVPRKHILSVQHLELMDKELIGELFLTAKKIAEQENIADKGYKLVFNVGRGGGQMIDHLHLHLIGGWKSKEEREIPGMP